MHLCTYIHPYTLIHTPIYMHEHVCAHTHAYTHSFGHPHLHTCSHGHTQGDGYHLISNSKDQSIKLWDIRHLSPQEGVAATRAKIALQKWDYRMEAVPRRGRDGEEDGKENGWGGMGRRMGGEGWGGG